MSQIINTIWSWFTSLVDTIWNIYNSIVDFLSFWRWLIDWLAYWFNTVVSKIYHLFNKLSFYDYFSENDFVMWSLDSLLWSPALQIIIIFLSLIIILIILRFVFSLIPFFNKKR